MREILFRGKTEQGEWMYGDLANGYKESWIVPDEDFMEKTFSEDLWENYLTSREYYKVVPSTIGQYTGLKDKNGTKIFEGDILAVKFYHRYVERLSWRGDPDAIAEVIYDFSGFRLKCKGKEDTRYADLEDFLTQRQFEEDMVDVCLNETEVIGNIHENKELEVKQ